VATHPWITSKNVSMIKMIRKEKKKEYSSYLISVEGKER
jgi:hypothetical protein